MSLLRICVILLLLSCEKKDEVIPVGDNEIIVQYQGSATKEMNGKTWNVSFDSIKENSLCGPDVVCVWQGRLVINLKINEEQTALGLGDLTTDTNEILVNEIIMDDVTIRFKEARDYSDNFKTKIVLIFE